MLTLEAGKSYRRRDGSKDTIVENDGDHSYPFVGADGDCYTTNGRFYRHRRSPRDLVAEWPSDDAPTGPVRTVTRKEIVPGVYGLVTVENRVGGCRLALPRDNFFCADNVGELRAAIATLTEIADAMEAR